MPLVSEDALMLGEELLVGLAPAVIALLPDLVRAINSGDSERARQLAEEAAQRQAFEALQRRKRRAPRNGG